MKKIPTLFERIYDDNGRVIGITDNVKSGFEWVLYGLGVATVKFDGSCCAIINGVFYKRYDAKKGKIPPAGAIPCTPEPDPITGHWPHWVRVSETNNSDKWFISAFHNKFHFMPDGIMLPQTLGTYEAIGKHFNGDPYRMRFDYLIRHGSVLIDKCPRSFEGIKDYLNHYYIEGIVFWKDGEPQCKIKRSDFGYIWPVTI